MKGMYTKQDVSIKAENVLIKNAYFEVDFCVAWDAYKAFKEWKHERIFNDEGQSAGMKMIFKRRTGLFKEDKMETFTYQDGNEIIISLEK